jgi:hydroxyacylglutathione hydrolase
METARKYLLRLGFDNIEGYLCTGIKSWRNIGKRIGHFGTMSVMELEEKINDNKIGLLDVRSKEEYNEGHLKDAINIYIGELKGCLQTLDKKKPIAVMCSIGDRAGIGASILDAAGFSEVYNVLGGITAWKNLKLPLEK